MCSYKAYADTRQPCTLMTLTRASHTLYCLFLPFSFPTSPFSPPQTHTHTHTHQMYCDNRESQVTRIYCSHEQITIQHSTVLTEFKIQAGLQVTSGVVANGWQVYIYGWSYHQDCCKYANYTFCMTQHTCHVTHSI